MTIVVLDGYTLNPGDLSWDEVKKYGDVVVYDRTSITDETEIIGRIGNAEIVLTNKTPLTKTVFERCSSIKYVGVLATGYNIVDIKAANENGSIVTNIPTYGTTAVSQFAFALLLEICHHVGHHSNAVFSGRWSTNADWCFWDYPLIELAGKTIGIVGFGRIGQNTAEIAKAFGMKVLAYDNYQTEEGKMLAEYVELDRLFENADIISLHCPLLPSTEGLINRDTIGQMKDGVILINTSRGPLINEADLVDALNSGKVMAAGLDVVSTEPIKKDNPLLNAKNCLITPHIAWAPKESRRRLMNIAIENMKAFLDGEATNVVS